MNRSRALTPRLSWCSEIDGWLGEISQFFAGGEPCHGGSRRILRYCRCQNVFITLMVPSKTRAHVCVWVCVCVCVCVYMNAMPSIYVRVRSDSYDAHVRVCVYAILRRRGREWVNILFFGAGFRARWRGAEKSRRSARASFFRKPLPWRRKKERERGSRHNEGTSRS